jgi:hypothetical protein
MLIHQLLEEITIEEIVTEVTITEVTITEVIITEEIRGTTMIDVIVKETKETIEIIVIIVTTVITVITEITETEIEIVIARIEGNPTRIEVIREVVVISLQLVASIILILYNRQIL